MKNIWKRKQAAFLHDPPHKALDIQDHVKRRKGFVASAGLTPDDMDWYEKDADRWSACADRFGFPSFKESGLCSKFDGCAQPFKHPLSDQTSLHLKAPLHVDRVEELLQQMLHYAQNLPDGLSDVDRDRVNFFLHWRRWAVDAARTKTEWGLPYLPADTRLPDHSIWHHNAFASAMQGCFDPQSGAMEPALLLFQAGPVQEFIAQARSTRDLWSGSYLLSWLMAHALKAVTDRVGPDAVVYPFLRAQPLFDLLHRDKIYARVPYMGPEGREQTLWDRMKLHENEILTPNLPNRFLAIVPEGQAAELAGCAEMAFRAEWKRIAEASWTWLDRKVGMKDAWRPRFDAQIDALPQIAWQTLPWGEYSDAALKDFEKVNPVAGANLRAVHNASEYKPNRGFIWPCVYDEIDRALAARRNLREFDFWRVDGKEGADLSLAGAVKDSLSGKEEVIGDESFWKKTVKEGELKHLFRSGDKLGAPNLVKRVWHKAYLAAAPWNLKVEKATRFDSVPDVAAGAWFDDVVAKVRRGVMESRETFDAILRASQAAAEHAEAWGLRVADEKPTEQNIDQWIEAASPELFMPASWKEKKESCEPVLKALNELYRFRKSKEGKQLDPILTKPPNYVAVIALDGDEMGKWISGEKTPSLMAQFSEEAREYFGNKGAKSLANEVRRPLSPSFHMQFSEALANFSLYFARPVVEHFGGQLIYSGGDDVLAMVPAAQALACAEALRAAFRGDSTLADRVPDRFVVHGEKGGWLALAKSERKGEQPNWPLLAPGPNANVSVGIAIGHDHAPLQELVREAQAAEHRAKNKLGRAAFAISLFKRSGEIVQWGAKWNSGALTLYALFDQLTENDQLSGKFAYALEALLLPYRPSSSSVKDVADFPRRAVLMRELNRVLDRQYTGPKETKRETVQAFRAAIEAYLDELEKQEEKERAKKGAAPSERLRHDPMVELPGLFRVANFIRRGERE